MLMKGLRSKSVSFAMCYKVKLLRQRETAVRNVSSERLEARIAQQFISPATMAATSSTPSRR